jgi:hypothetical protein
MIVDVSDSVGRKEAPTALRQLFGSASDPDVGIVDGRALTLID